MTSTILPANQAPNDRRKQIEDYPAGYPQLSAIIGAHPSLNVFRRFLRLRARLMLQKQEQLAHMESRLDAIDSGEQRRFYLATFRGDRNAERNTLLNQMDAALRDYDDFSERTERTIARVSPRPRDVQNLQNWVENTGAVVEEETLFLGAQDDLLSLGSLGRDEVVRILEGPAEDAIIWLRAMRGCNSYDI
ncbi:hypothetical protein PG991_014053 [Apiospora marii]|uniref:DUF6594 domain-containing protein n=1 Tax=Apiospora marii TaxID=335849 RepID=A0ABR1R8L7_9PEZI